MAREPAHDDPAAELARLRDRVAALEAEARRMRQGRDELLELIDVVPVAIRWVTPDGRIAWANRADVELTGYTRDAYVGRHLSELHADDEAARDLVERLDRHEALRDYPARLRRRDGSVRHVRLDSMPSWRDGALVDTRIFTRAVTFDLGGELAARERFRELFLGMLGHDLRNPLGTIAMSADVLELRGGRADGERLDAQSLLVVKRIARSAARMSRMVDQILDFARLNAGSGIPLCPQPLDLVDVCAGVIDELRAMHPARAIEIQSTGNGWATGDPDRLSQVFSNLIGNAVTHGDPGGPVHVSITGDPERLTVRVRNTGPPIPPEVIPTVFDPFRRAPRATRDKAGLGLGLYITREIVQAHGGTIAVSSTAEDGTMFSASLPRRRG